MSSGSDTGGQPPKSPLQEITQPFVDLMHAPRALWGINLAYVLEGMVYFGMLGYLAIYCSEYIFQGIDGANEAAHYMVMVLTAGITISMFFLGAVADKKGVRFALIAAFVCMLLGRIIWAGAPSLFGLEPVRPPVVVGDEVSVHVTALETRYGNKTITQATLISNDESSLDVDQAMKIDLASGEGIAPGEELESKLVQLQQARVISGEGKEWKIQYGSAPVTAKLLIRGADELHLHPGATISLDRAYVTRNDDERELDPDKKPTLRKGAKISLNRAIVIKQGDEYVIKTEWPEDISSVDISGCDPDVEYVIRSHWVSDVNAINTFPVELVDGSGIKPSDKLDAWEVQLRDLTLEKGKNGEWEIAYGDGDEPVKARLIIEGDKQGTIDDQMILDLASGDGTPLDATLCDDPVQMSRAKLLSGKGQDWTLEYGHAAITARLHIRSGHKAALAAGTLIALRRADVIQATGADGFSLRATWPDDFSAIDNYGCAESPYRDVVTVDERDLKVTERPPTAASIEPPADAESVSIAELRDMEDGQVNVVLNGAHVTYVRNGGYTLQEDKEGPAIGVFVSPFGSGLQIVTLIGMLIVVIGYGMYQPAAYAGVRKFTTPKTAAMGFAMLYALMNLGGWLPTFAFLARDDDYLGLGITGTFWIYAGVTVLALLVTLVILSRKTVLAAETAAKEETSRIKAEEKDKNQDAESSSAGKTKSTEDGQQQSIKPHMWLFWVGAIALLLFKGESPWYYSWTEASEGWTTAGLMSGIAWRWILAGVVFVSPAFLAAIPAARSWIGRHPLRDPKFAFFIFALIPVQTLFTYNWLILPAYIKRAFDGWIGDYFEIAANANPILIFIAVPIITALTMRAKIYNMMIIGTFVMAAPAFLLVLGPHWWTLLAYIFIMTIGEAMWQPRFLQYAAEIAPEGRTGEYMGVAQLPWFLTKVLVPLLYSGKMMDRFCPAEGEQNTQLMWFIFACIAMTSTVLLVLAKPWFGKDFKTKAD